MESSLEGLKSTKAVKLEVSRKSKSSVVAKLTSTLRVLMKAGTVPSRI